MAECEKDESLEIACQEKEHCWKETHDLSLGNQVGKTENSFLSKSDAVAANANESEAQLTVETRTPVKSHVAKEQNKTTTADQTTTKTPAKTLETPPTSVTPEIKVDSNISPDTPSKRRRVQHNYRRLSSSGYLDDYEGRERFSGKNGGDADASTIIMTMASPSSPNTKPHARHSKVKHESTVNGIQSRNG